jgi:ribulose bisphosphate carboxylase small subunit
MSGNKQLTVFTATVYPDVARIWYACVQRAFPTQATKFEIFYDSDGKGLPLGCFEGAEIMRRTAERRDHHDAYNDAVRRAETPYLAIIDTDVFWTSGKLWADVRGRLNRPEVAAVSCVSRSRRKSHGTYAVILKPQIYRQVLEKLPDGFYPGAELLDPKLPITQWRWFDTGDILTQAVMDAGYMVELLHFDKSREIVRFYGITLSRRGGRNFGAAALTEMAGKDKYFWRGYVSNLVLQRVYRRVFRDGPEYDFPFRSAPLVLRSLRAKPSVIAWRYGFLRHMLRGGRQIETFLREAPVL